MRFQNVSVASLAYVDAPLVVTTAELARLLAPTAERLGIRLDLLTALTGIEERRFWPPGVQPSEVATAAAEQALAQAGVDRGRVGVVVSTSVCKDYIEPSVASLVHGNLRLEPRCLNFDVGNACLAFLNGMELVGAMIERGAIDYGLVVDGEGSRQAIEATVARLREPSCDARVFRDNFATLTLGSGAAAVVLARSELVPSGHRFLGGVALAATEYNRLCVGQPDEMRTDPSALLTAGVELARRTFAVARAEMGWSAEALDELVLHQVSAVHTDRIVEMIGTDPRKVFAIYPHFGNIGPASIPIVLGKSRDAGRLRPGSRVALMGIGSGLNCSMMEIVWLARPAAEVDLWVLSLGLGSFSPVSPRDKCIVLKQTQGHKTKELRLGPFLAVCSIRHASQRERAGPDPAQRPTPAPCNPAEHPPYACVGERRRRPASALYACVGGRRRRPASACPLASAGASSARRVVVAAGGLCDGGFLGSVRPGRGGSLGDAPLIAREPVRGLLAGVRSLPGLLTARERLHGPPRHLAAALPLPGPPL